MTKVGQGNPHKETPQGGAPALFRAHQRYAKKPWARRRLRGALSPLMNGGGRLRACWLEQQPFAAKAQLGGAADYQMIMQHDAKGAERLIDSFCHLDIALRRAGVT